MKVHQQCSVQRTLNILEISIILVIFVESEMKENIVIYSKLPLIADDQFEQ